MNAEPTFAIIAGTLWGNRGAEAMLVTTIGRIRAEMPDAQFKVFSYYPRKDAELCQDENIEVLDCRPLVLALGIVPLAICCVMFGWLRIRLPGWVVGKQVRALRDCDAMLDVGGITFCDGREIFLLFNVLSLLPAIVLGVPVYKLSQAMGPFHSRINRLAARWTLGRCAKVFSRGPQTSGHLRALGLPEEKWSEAADIAFAFSTDYSLSNENEQRVAQLESEISQRQRRGAKIAAIIPSSLLFKKHEDYTDKIVRLIRALLAKNVHVVVLPNATRAGIAKTRNNDLVAIEHVLAALDEAERKRISAVTFDVNTASIRRLLKCSDLVVTSRFHGMVAALAAAIPVVVVGWSHKYSEVLAQFHCDEFGLNHSASSDAINAVAMRVLDQSSRQRKKLEAAIADVKSSAENQFDETLRHLKTRSRQRATSTADIGNLSENRRTTALRGRRSTS